MIRDNEITLIGYFGKPHGVNGEINLLTDVDVEALSCVIVDVDGINVPFFPDSVRPRGTGSYLVVMDGLTNEDEVIPLVNRKVYALKQELISAGGGDPGPDGDGFYAEDLIGYDVEDAEAGLSGIIEDVDDTTENVLFVVRAGDGRRILIPVADEFIRDIDVDNRHVTLYLPAGILDL